MNQQRHKFSLGSFNVRGLTKQYKQEQLAHDMINYKLDICCLQETKITNGMDININDHRLICIPTDCRHYGNGFIVSPKWKHNIHKYWKVSDRLSVIQLKLRDDEYICEQLNGINLRVRKAHHYTANLRKDLKMAIKKPKVKKLLTIINVYAPTTKKVTENVSSLDEMYAQLGTLFSEFKNTSLILIAGDFNAKVGKSKDMEMCLGKYSRGIRNNSGQSLIDFCNIHQLFISNSAFKHPARHITTWENHKKDTKNNKMISIYNQIDYIICQQKQKHILIDSRSYNGTLVSSDHRLLVSRMNLEFFKIYKPANKPNTKQYNCSLLTSDIDKREEYQNNLTDKLEHIGEEIDWDIVKNCIVETAIQTIGYNKIHPNKRPHNLEIEQMSRKQKDLRIQISNCNNIDKAKEMKTERNQIMHRIKRKLIELKEKDLDNKVNEINEMKDSSKMFKAVNMLKRKKFENPYVHDEKGKNVTDPVHIHKIIKLYFENQFIDQNTPKLEPFTDTPRKLIHPISNQEVLKSISKLNNNRSAGYDTITAELIKYGPENLRSIIKTILNNCFEQHKQIDIGKGILVALQKPGKPKGPVKNLRPVILLPIIRKILSNIVLQRIKPKVEKYLSQSQSAYRQYRSTSDIIWTHRWVISRAQIVKEIIYITGIDMSSAFDTIKRDNLIEIISTFLDEDEIRMIRFLLTNTTLEIKMNNIETQPFESNIGSPQGDGLSGTLFNIYFEHALRKLRSQLQQNDAIQHTKTLNELIYADDADFLTSDIQQDKKLNRIVKDVLLAENLKVNETKTEHTTIERKDKNDEKWRTVKKLGSLLGDVEDIARRKQLSIVSLSDMNNVWIRNDHIKQELKLKLYQSLVKPVLTYNSGTWGLTKTQENNLDSFHRQQLRKVLNIKYPARISNQNLYKLSKQNMLSLDILTARWKLFGHILRSNLDTPANIAMNNYFDNTNTTKFKGRPRTTLPTTLNQDIKRTKLTQYNIEQLKTKEDLENLREIAIDRHEWLNFVRTICDAAKAEKNISLV